MPSVFIWELLTALRVGKRAIYRTTYDCLFWEWCADRVWKYALPCSKIQFRYIGVLLRFSLCRLPCSFIKQYDGRGLAKRQVKGSPFVHWTDKQIGEKTGGWTHEATKDWWRTLNKHIPQLPMVCLLKWMKVTQNTHLSLIVPLQDVLYHILERAESLKTGVVGFAWSARSYRLGCFLCGTLRYKTSWNLYSGSKV